MYKLFFLSELKLYVAEFLETFISDLFQRIQFLGTHDPYPAETLKRPKKYHNIQLIRVSTFTVCQRSIVHLYITTQNMKKGQDFLSIQFVNLSEKNHQ